MRSMEHIYIYQDIKNILIDQLFHPCDIFHSYKAFLSEYKPPPKHAATTSINSTDTRCCTTG